MDTVEFRAELFEFGIGPEEQVLIYVNGRDLRLLVENLPDQADAFWFGGLPPSMALAPSEHLLGRPDPRQRFEIERPWIQIYRCSCGDLGCSWASARIQVIEKDRVVIWDRFGPAGRADLFTFDLDDYRRALGFPKPPPRTRPDPAPEGPFHQLQL